VITALTRVLDGDGVAVEDKRSPHESDDATTLTGGISHRVAEKGQPDWVIQAQLGHVSPAMMKTYSHIRRQALDAAAAALEPSHEPSPNSSDQEAPAEAKAESPLDSDRVTSQSTSHSSDRETELDEFVKEGGSSGWTRAKPRAQRAATPEDRVGSRRLSAAKELAPQAGLEPATLRLTEDSESRDRDRWSTTKC
jgi:hypothetical protein